MWQAKAPAGETHSRLYSLGTRDCGGKERRKRGGSEEGAQVEALGYRDVQLSYPRETNWDLQPLPIHSCSVCTLPQRVMHSQELASVDRKRTRESALVMT